MASTPSVVAQELAEVRDLKALAEECGWDVNSKEYKDRLASINKKYKALMKMGSMTVSMQGGSSSAKQAKQNFIWVDSATRVDAGDMEEAVGKLPEIFGEGKYGTSGVNSRGGKQNFKAEECVWKRLSKDGKHYRIIQHSTGYFYQKGFLPSDTAEQDEAEGEEEINEGEGEEQEEEAQPPSKKKKGGKEAQASAKAPKAAKDAPKASPKGASKRASKRKQ